MGVVSMLLSHPSSAATMRMIPSLVSPDPGPPPATSRYFLHTKEDNLLCLDWKIDNLGRWLTAPAHRRGIYTFARIHSHTIGRIEYGLRME